MSGSALFAGTTPYKGRKGEQIASEKFSLLDRPRSPEFLSGAEFDGFGIPTKDMGMKDGVLNEFLIGFFMARKLGVPQTAGAGTSSFRPVILRSTKSSPKRAVASSSPVFQAAGRTAISTSPGSRRIPLCRGRRGETRARRNDGERQFPGASEAEGVTISSR